MEFPEPHFYISIETYYRDNKVDKNYIDNNPDLFVNYPNQSKVDSILSNLRKNQKKGVKYIIKVSELGIEVIES